MELNIMNYFDNTIVNIGYPMVDLDSVGLLLMKIEGIVNEFGFAITDVNTQDCIDIKQADCTDDWNTDILKAMLIKLNDMFL